MKHGRSGSIRMKPKNQTKPVALPAHSMVVRPLWIVLFIAGAAAVLPIAVFRSSVLSPVTRVEASPATSAANTTATFGPTIPNTTAAPASSPHGMAWVSGGEFSMGAMDPPATTDAGMHAAADARPIHRVYVDGFWMDKNDVTNEEFDQFRQGHRLRNHCGARAERGGISRRSAGKSGGGFVVFFATRTPCSLTITINGGAYVKGANWRHPEGPQSNIKGREKLSGRASCLRGRAGLCEVGGQAFADRSGVGIRGAWRLTGKTLLVGRRIPTGRQMDGKHYTRAISLTATPETMATSESLRSRQFPPNRLWSI